MKIRNGFVSNSSSSSFIISDIKERESYNVDYPPLSSMTEYLRLRNEGFFDDDKRHKEKSFKEQRNVYHISANGGKEFTVDSIYKIIQKYKLHAKVLDHYEDDWKSYLEKYDCIIMDISKVNRDQAKSIIDLEGGENYIWNSCHSGCDDWSYSFMDWKNMEDLSSEKRNIDYTENPLYKMFLNSPDSEILVKECIEANKKDSEAIDKYYAEFEKYRKGEITEKPEYPTVSEYCGVSPQYLMCKWCRNHKGNICFNVGEAIDEGKIFIYATENYLEHECIEEIEQTCQCILDAPHMG